METTVALRSPALSSASFGPFGVIEAIPWLMMASACRFIAYGGGFLAAPAITIANISLLLAFVIVVWRMVLASAGQSGLGTRHLRDQIRMAGAVLLPIFGLLVAMTTIGAAMAIVDQPGEFMFGFDGIAFDQRTHVGRLWSAFVAAIVLLMVLQTDEKAAPNLFVALRRFGRHARWLVPGVLLVAVLSALLHPVQGWFRYLVYLVWLQDGVPSSAKTLTYFAFVFLFATLRLWLTVTILVLALRRSYRADASA